MFLTPDELSQLTGYRPCQRTRICRWLDSQQPPIPYTTNRLGDPVVLRSAIEGGKHAEPEPEIKLDWLKKSA